MTETFETAMLSELGYAPKQIIADGKPHRFNIGKHKGRGWYVLHDGKFPTGVFGDWGTGEKHKWHLKNGACNLTAADRIRERKAKQDTGLPSDMRALRRKPHRFGKRPRQQTLLILTL
jgi:phage/plasmid primase-like uncharacterized protein